MKRLPRRREYLEIFFGIHASLKDGQHLPQRPSKKTNSDISNSRLHFTYSQANTPAPRKADISTVSKKTCYKARQVRQQKRYLS